MKAAIYTRVSTQEQATEGKTSLDQQRQRCEAFCQFQEWEVVNVYEDVTSGAKDLRPALRQMIRDAKAGGFERVVFYKLDRFGRNLRHLLNLSAELDEMGVGIASVTDNIDTSTPSGRAYFNMLGVFAEFERDLINDRMYTSKVAKIAAGKLYQASTVPYGYRRVRVTDETGRRLLSSVLEADPEEAPVVRRIFDLADAGFGSKVIAQKLDAEGIPTPSESRKGRRTGRRRPNAGWSWGTVSKLLKERRYIGEGTHGRKDPQSMACPALVPVDIFERVQSGLGDRRRRSPRNTKRDYLLRGLIYCRHCTDAANETARREGGTPRPVVYMSQSPHGQAHYFCRWAREVPGGVYKHDFWNLRTEALDEPVKRALTLILMDPQKLFEDAQVEIKQAQIRVATVDKRIKELEQEIAGFDAEHEGALRQNRRGVLDDETLDSVLAEIEASRAKAVVELDELREDALTGSSRTRIAFLETIRALVGTKTIPARRRVNGKLVEPVLVEDPETGNPRFEWLDPDEAPEPSMEAWQRWIRQLISSIWIEEDGTATIVGPGEAFKNKLEIGEDDTPEGYVVEARSKKKKGVSKNPRSLLLLSNDTISYSLSLSLAGAIRAS